MAGIDQCTGSMKYIPLKDATHPITCMQDFLSPRSKYIWNDQVLYFFSNKFCLTGSPLYDLKFEVLFLRLSIKSCKKKSKSLLKLYLIQMMVGQKIWLTDTLYQKVFGSRSDKNSLSNRPGGKNRFGRNYEITVPFQKRKRSWGFSNKFWRRLYCRSCNKYLLTSYQNPPSSVPGNTKKNRAT